MQTKQGLSKKIDVHGHRGSRGTHPENVLPAFEEANDAQADAIELDLHLSKDGVLYVVHDPLISNKLCTDKDGNPISKPLFVGNLTAQELDTFECGNKVQPDFPQQKNNLRKGVKIPRFEEVLDWQQRKAPHLLINAELKMDAPKGYSDPDRNFFVKQFLDLIGKYKVEAKTFAQSFDLDLMKILREKAPGLACSCLFEWNATDIIKKTKALGCPYISPYKSFINPKFVENCHKEGLKVLPWTLNTLEEWKNAKTSCVDGIISDYPRALIQFLKEEE